MRDNLKSVKCCFLPHGNTYWNTSCAVSCICCFWVISVEYLCGTQKTSCNSHMLKLWLCQPGCSLIGVLVLAAISGGYAVDTVVLSPQYCIGQSTNFTAFYDCFLKKRFNFYFKANCPFIWCSWRHTDFIIVKWKFKKKNLIILLIGFDFNGADPTVFQS